MFLLNMFKDKEMEFLLPKSPHNAIICGKTNSGKTYLVLNIIENYYLDFFNYIVFLCPTIKKNKTNDREWLNDSRVIKYDSFNLMTKLD